MSAKTALIFFDIHCFMGVSGVSTFSQNKIYFFRAKKNILIKYRWRQTNNLRLLICVESFRFNTFFYKTKNKKNLFSQIQLLTYSLYGFPVLLAYAFFIYLLITTCN